MIEFKERFGSHSISKVPSHLMCMYVLVTEKSGLICKEHLSYTCDFITEYHGRTDPTIKIHETHP